MDVDTTYDGRPRLAQELLDLTLDHLHYDPESLKQSALASKSLLPTCQRHLFSTCRITEKFAKLFVTAVSGERTREDASLRARVAELLDTYTTHLILTDHPRLASRFDTEEARLPQFKSVQRITFQGDELYSAVTIPLFLIQAWTSPSFGLRSVEFDFRRMCEKAIIETLYLLPATVDSISFTCEAGPTSAESSLTAASLRRDIKRLPLLVGYHSGVRYINGTLRLRLASTFLDLPPVILELEDLFRFGLKRISCRITSRKGIGNLASLVDECKDTLQSLDIPTSSTRAYGATHHRISGFQIKQLTYFPT